MQLRVKLVVVHVCHQSPCHCCHQSMGSEIELWAGWRTTGMVRESTGTDKGHVAGTSADLSEPVGNHGMAESVNKIVFYWPVHHIMIPDQPIARGGTCTSTFPRYLPIGDSDWAVRDTDGSKDSCTSFYVGICWMNGEQRTTQVSEIFHFPAGNALYMPYISQQERKAWLACASCAEEQQRARGRDLGTPRGAMPS